jgi:hypothetical protein
MKSLEASEKLEQYGIWKTNQKMIETTMSGGDQALECKRQSIL